MDLRPLVVWNWDNDDMELGHWWYGLERVVVWNWDNDDMELGY